MRLIKKNESLKISVQPLDFLQESIHGSLAFRFGENGNGWRRRLQNPLSITVVIQIKDGHTLVGCGRRSEA
jgi:hypothetical protein